eukprot:34406-Rhodomonas_salina.2
MSGASSLCQHPSSHSAWHAMMKCPVLLPDAASVLYAISTSHTLADRMRHAESIPYDLRCGLLR